MRTLKPVTLCWMALGLMWSEGFALADHRSPVPVGYFRNESGTLRIFIKTSETTGYFNTYGLVFKESKSRSESTTAGLFVIESLLDGSQIWRQVFQTGSQILGVDYNYETDFTGKFERQDSKTVLKLVSTEYRKTICGAAETLEAYAQAGRSWDVTPKGGLQLVDEKKNEKEMGEFFGETLKLKDGTPFGEGDFAPTEIVPGLMTFRTFKIDSVAFAGRSLSRPISFLGVVIHLGSYRELRLLGTAACWNQAVVLDERH